MREWFPKEKIPRVPPKHFLRSGISKELVEERKELLQKYVEELLSIPKVASSPQFAQWFFPSNDVSQQHKWKYFVFTRIAASICIIGQPQQNRIFDEGGTCIQKLEKTILYFERWCLVLFQTPRGMIHFLSFFPLFPLLLFPVVIFSVTNNKL